MRIGIVGTGFMGRTHAASWAVTGATLAGFLTKSDDGVALSEQYQAKLYADLDEMLADVDVVDICAPTHLHYEFVLAAAAAGKHVVCEKPLARTLAQGQEMIAACDAAGVKLLVAHVVRFFPEYVATKAQVAAGTIGNPAVLRLSRGSFQPKKSQDNWFVDFAKSGGLILDLMIHDLDFARWVAGDVVSVFAKKMSSSFADTAVDHSLVILKHKSGAISHVEGSWAYPPPMFRTRFEIAGSNGLIRHDSAQTAALSMHHYQTDDDVPDVALPGSPLSEDPYTTQIKAFYASLLGETEVPITGEDGLAALQIGLAAIESAETGRPVALNGGAEL